MKIEIFFLFTTIFCVLQYFKKIMCITIITHKFAKGYKNLKSRLLLKTNVYTRICKNKKNTLKSWPLLQKKIFIHVFSKTKKYHSHERCIKNKCKKSCPLIKNKYIRLSEYWKSAVLIVLLTSFFLIEALSIGWF